MLHWEGCALREPGQLEHDVIVVGGGPAGMMAAGRAAERGRHVLLLERGTALGQKLLLTGSGRCNVTNSAPLPKLIRAFGRQGDFLRQAFTTFGNTHLLQWLHARGVETVEERNGRVFPATQDAHTILNALTDYLKAGGVETRYGHRVQSLLIEGRPGRDARITGVLANGRQRPARSVLVATGGLSYPATGSAGDGYELARQAGHTLVPTYPAIVALETHEGWPRKVQGTPIKNVAIRAASSGPSQEKRKQTGDEGRKTGDEPKPRGAGRKLAETFGEALWTHYGISGPAILDISRDVVVALQQGRTVRLELDLRPSDSEAALDERLLFAIKKKGKELMRTVLSQWVPERTAALLLDLSGIGARKKMSQCSKADRRRIGQFMKHLELHIARPRPIEEAIVTGGGVALGEVDAKRMESRLVRGLHFAGEVLDIDGPCGGFNLQAAFSTGYLAGENV